MTPWPAFSLACRKVNPEEDDLPFLVKERLFPALAEGAAIFTENFGNQSVQRIEQMHGHSEEDAKAWLSQVRYATDRIF